MFAYSKNKIVKIAKFFTSNALLLALDGPLVVLFGYMLYGIDVNITIIAASFLGVFSIYTLNKATDKREDRLNKPDQCSRSATYYVAISFVTMIFSDGFRSFGESFCFSHSSDSDISRDFV